jgi:opacity protein-like surface antigen
MKKLLLAAVFAVFALPSFAGIDEGIDAGMTYVSVLGGFAAPIDGYQPVNYSGSVDYGDAGPSYGAQIMHHISPYFGIGAEFNATNYDTAKDKLSTSSYENKADKYSFMLAGKINFAPAAKTRLYIPFGAGYSRFKGTVNNITTHVSGEETSTKPAFYAGLGVETDLNDIFIFGIEGRYNYFQIDKDKFDSENGYLDDVSLLVKLGIKF